MTVLSTPPSAASGDPGTRLTRIRPTRGWSAEDFREIWHFRELLVTFAVRDVKAGSIKREGDGSVSMSQVRLLDAAGRPTVKALGGEDLLIEIDYDNPSGRRRAAFKLNVYDDGGKRVTSAHTELTGAILPLERRGSVRCRLRRLPLTLGSYRLALALDADGSQADVLLKAAKFDVVSSVFYPTGQSLPSSEAAVHCDHEWEQVPSADAKTLSARADALAS